MYLIAKGYFLANKIIDMPKENEIKRKHLLSIANILIKILFSKNDGKLLSGLGAFKKMPLKNLITTNSGRNIVLK